MPSVIVQDSKNGENIMKYLLVIAVITPLAVDAVENGDTQAGISLGSPGAFNLVIKKELSGHPLQLAIGYVGSAYGIETGYSFYHDRDSFMRSWQAIAGTFRAEDRSRVLDMDAGGYRWRYDDDSWSYVGVSGTFQYGGFFLEPGLSVGTGDYSNPQLTIQVGWVWAL